MMMTANNRRLLRRKKAMVRELSSRFFGSHRGARRTVVLSHLDGKLVEVARGKYAGAGEMEQKAYDTVYANNGGPVYDCVVVRRLLDIIAKLAGQVRIVSKSGDRNDPICSPWPRTVGDLRSALCGYGAIDLRVEREMLVGNDRKTPAMPHLTGTEFVSLLKEFEDATPVRMLGKDGRKCGPPACSWSGRATAPTT